MPRIIVHLDADAFYASVEQAADPRLRGKPVAVGGEKRGIIASASYEARKFGVFTPMPTARARKLCPKLIILPGDYDRYEKFSRRMFSFAQDFTPDVEISSIDEGYFDLSGVRKPPVDVAETIRSAIRQTLKITVSEGIGSNKLVSQIASKLLKPAAFSLVPTGKEIAFLHPLVNRWLPGVGPQTAKRLDAAGLAFIRQIAGTQTDMLQMLVGSAAPTLKAFANGIDERPVVAVSAPAKSYGQQQTFEADITDEEYAEAVLRRMADELMATVRDDGKSVRTVTVKIRYNDMLDDQAGESLLEPTDLETDIYGRIHALFRRAWRRRVSLRLVSLKLSNVYGGIFHSELPLEHSTDRHAARRRLAEAVDALRKSRGRQVILRGHDFRLRSKPGATTDSETDSASPPVTAASLRHRARANYLPLAVHSNYSFLNSTLSVESIVESAKRHGLPAVALADVGNLHGAVEFVLAARRAGIKPIIGATVPIEGCPARLYVENAHGYRNLCQLLSRPERGATGAKSTLKIGHLDGLADGLIAVSADARLATVFPKRFYLAVNSPEQARSGHPCAAVLPVRYATPEDRWKFDVVQSIRTLSLLRQAHPEKQQAGEFHFRSPAEMRTVFGERAELLDATIEIAQRCNFNLTLGPPQFPAFAPPDASPPRAFLRQLVTEGLRRRYGNRAENHRQQVAEELSIIGEVGYEDYFLVVWDILQECRRRGIEWITRGSAADSLVCYCLGISDVCPIRFDLYFRRFLNKERMALNKLPDIDIDFPHDRKDDVVKLVFEKYGCTHAAVVGGFSTFQARSAFAEVAKVLGVAERDVRKFTEHFPWGFGGGWVPDEPAPKGGAGLIKLLRANPETRDLPFDDEPYRSALQMAEFLDGFPRYPKMHPCGVVLSRQPMHDLTPTFISQKGYPTTHFDMDSVESIGLVKIDILAQGGLAVMRDARESLTKRGVAVELQKLEPWEDPEVWEMISNGGARAVHHIESPAMTSLCRMTDVREIDGLIAIVSVIRPGAANESKKLSFTRRYQGMEPVTYPHPSLESCLRSTFGLVVYEEHILQICEAFAGLPPGRADVLRRALVKQKRETVEEISHEFTARARQRGHDDAKIAEVWQLVTGFSGYAFNKAHSTAYGVEAYQAAWLKRYHPAEFMAAVLTNGKGFYHPLVYVLECHRLGIRLLPPCVNRPGPAFSVEDAAIRVPLTRVKGLTERLKERLIAEYARGTFSSQSDFYRRVSPTAEEIESMIRVGAFDDFGRTRTAQFWEARHLDHAFGGVNESGQGWLLPPPATDRLPEVLLQEPTRRQRLEWEAELLDFTASAHPLELHDDIAWETYCPVAKLGEHVGETVVTCGLIVEQRTHHQITGEPMKFLTLADRTGMAETELFAATYRNYGLATVRYPVLEVTATVEPFENGRGFSLRVLRAGKPRTISDGNSNLS